MISNLATPLLDLCLGSCNNGCGVWINGAASGIFVLVGGSCGAADVDGGVVRLVSRQVDLTGQPVRNSSDNFVSLLNRGFV